MCARLETVASGLGKTTDRLSRVVTRLRGRDAPGASRRLLLAAIVVLAAVSLAGCSLGPLDDPASSEPASSDPASSEPASESPAPVESTADDGPTLASVGVDANATWNRTLDLLAVAAEQPTVAVRATEPPIQYQLRNTEYVEVFAGAALEPGASAWYDPGADVVVLKTAFVEGSSAEMVEGVLAHEYAHAVQFQHGWESPNASEGLDDEPLVPLLYGEGMASYVQSAYVQRHLEDTSALSMRNMSAGNSIEMRFPFVAYLEGARYYEDRLESPEQLPVVVDDPPTTSEQVLHDVEEGPRPLTVEPEYDISNVSATNGRARGELATREILRTAVDPDRAAAAAAGWGNDELQPFHDPGRDRRGYVWVHRWDDAAEADEFQRAARELLDQRRTETDEYAFEYRRLAPETTVMIAGTNGFTDEAEVRAEGNESVSVTVSS